MTSPVAPGWYQDPPGSGALRWWDGTRWHPAPGTIEQPPLAPGTRTDTWSIWTMTLLPVLGPVLMTAEGMPALLRAQFETIDRQLQGAASGHVVLPFAGGFVPVLIVNQLVGLVFLAAQVLLAAADHRALGRLGVVRPFHWAWAFLQPVYLIGRAVVVHRRTEQGLAPLWVWVAVEVAALAVTVVTLASALPVTR